MKPNTRKYALIALCALALVFVGKTVVGIVGLLRYQDVPFVPVGFELTMFIGAALIPLTVALRHEEERKKWHYLIWAPCILYVIGVGINSLVRSPFDARYVFGIARFAGWLAIAALFIRGAQKKSQPT